LFLGASNEVPVDPNRLYEIGAETDITTILLPQVLAQDAHRLCFAQSVSFKPAIVLLKEQFILAKEDIMLIREAYQKWFPIFKANAISSRVHLFGQLLCSAFSLRM
jgi:hypothetical protein